MEGNSISKERREFLRKIKRENTYVIVARIMVLVLFLAVWEVSAQLGLIDKFITSCPSRIAKTLISLYKAGDLFKHVGITCLETIIGFVLGTTLGTLIAALIWWSKFLARVLEPYLVVLNSLPKVALGPVFIVWIGAGPASIIVMALAVSLIVTIMEVIGGFLSIDSDKIELVQTFGAKKNQIFSKVILPASFPTIISALKINVGLSWVGAIVGEFLVSKAGLGYLIVYGGQVFQLDLVMTSVFILATAAALMYQGVVYLEKILVGNRSH